MAVSRRYECDLSGDELGADAVMVVRVGTVQNRPDDCERFDIGPCCYSRGPLLELYMMMVERRQRAGQDRHGNAVEEEHSEPEQEQAAARI